MRKILVVLGAILVITTACSTKNESSDFSSDLTEVEEIAAGIDAEVLSFNLEEAKEQADLIAEVTIIDKVEEVKQEPIPHTVFRAEVKKAFKGNVKNEEITIKQQGDSEWTVNNTELFKAGEKYIFFLKETKSINADYWIIGEETGMFKILDDNEVIIKLLEPIDELKKIEILNNNVTNSLNSEIDSEQSQILSYKGFIENIQIKEGGN